MRLLIASLASLVLISIVASVPRTFGQECTSVVAENNTNDSRLVMLRLSASDSCTQIYGFYVQLERNGTVRQITSTPAGWNYGESEKTAFWTTETEPIDSRSEIFGMELQAHKPYTSRWIALDERWSPVAEGILVGQ